MVWSGWCLRTPRGKLQCVAPSLDGPKRMPQWVSSIDDTGQVKNVKTLICSSNQRPGPFSVASSHHPSGRRAGEVRARKLKYNTAGWFPSEIGKSFRSSCLKTIEKSLNVAAYLPGFRGRSIVSGQKAAVARSERCFMIVVMTGDSSDTGSQPMPASERHQIVCRHCTRAGRYCAQTPWLPDTMNR
jgi:hypothetical protein